MNRADISKNISLALQNCWERGSTGVDCSPCTNSLAVEHLRPASIERTGRSVPPRKLED
jgi:hypothetical protein